MIKFISNIRELPFSQPYEAAAVEGYIHPGTIDEVVEWLNGVSQFCCDTETTGIFNHSNKVIMLQIGNEEMQFVIDVRGISKSEIDRLKPYFEDNNITKIFHNAKFDINMIRFTFGWIIENILDTFLRECIITNGMKERSLGLGYLCSRYCGINDMDKAERLSFLTQGDKPFNYNQISYGAKDVEVLPCIVIKQTPLLDEYNLLEVSQLENEACIVLADIEYNGMVLDSEKWAVLANEAVSNMQSIEKELDVMVCDEPKLAKYKNLFVQTGLFGEEGRRVSIKWTSPVQLLRVFRDLGLEVESTGEKEITKYQNQFALIKRFIDYKKEQKMATTYGLKFLDNINPVTGRIHTNFWQILDTHRVSSSDPNMQQIPTKSVKLENGDKIYPYLNCFIAPMGMKLVACDYAGQELRIITEGSQEPLWINSFTDGKDLHGEITSLIFNIPIEQVKSNLEFVTVGTTKVFLRGKSPRDIIKTVNFMLAFGGSEYKLSDTFGIKVKEAKAIIDRYFEVIPLVEKFLNSCASYGVKNNFIRSFKPLSIIRHFSGYNMNDKKERGEVERMSKNTPIQGTASIMTKLAMIAIRRRIKTLDYKVEIIMQIHDSIMCYVDENHAEEWGAIQKEVMETCGRIFIKTIPVLADISISDFWSK